MIKLSGVERSCGSCVHDRDSGTEYCGPCHDGDQWQEDPYNLEQRADAEIAALKAEVELFRGCCERAVEKWRQSHPDAESWPDGAVQLVEALERAEARVAALEAEHANLCGACDGWCGAAFDRWRARAEKAEASVAAFEGKRTEALAILLADARDHNIDPDANCNCPGCRALAVMQD